MRTALVRDLVCQSPYTNQAQRMQCMKLAANLFAQIIRWKEAWPGILRDQCILASRDGGFASLSIISLHRWTV